MSKWPHYLIEVGKASALLIPISSVLFFILKNYITSKFDQLKDVQIEKIKNEFKINQIDFQHQLSIKFDKIKNIQDQQITVLSNILQTLNEIVVNKYNEYNYTEECYPLFKTEEIKKAKLAIYSNGLYICGDSLFLITKFFEIAQQNSDWIYDAVGQDDFSIIEFDLQLLEAINNEIFYLFRKQLEIDKTEFKSNLEEIKILATMSINRNHLKNKSFQDILYSKDDINDVIFKIKNGLI